MKSKKLKLILIAGGALLFSTTGLFVGQKYFVLAQSSNQLESLPAVKPDINRNKVANHSGKDKTQMQVETNLGTPTIYDFSTETVGAMPVLSRVIEVPSVGFVMSRQPAVNGMSCR